MSTVVKNYTVKMTLPNGTILYSVTDQTESKKIDSYSQIDSEFEFCVENYDEATLFTFRYVIGVEVRV